MLRSFVTLRYECLTSSCDLAAEEMLMLRRDAVLLLYSVRNRSSDVRICSLEVERCDEASEAH